MSGYTYETLFKEDFLGPAIQSIQFQITYFVFWLICFFGYGSVFVKFCVLPVEQGHNALVDSTHRLMEMEF